MKRILFIFSILLNVNCYAQFCGPAGSIGSSAIHKDSSAFKSWATNCLVVRGYQDISDNSFGLATTGIDSSGIDIAGINGTVSLGDGGSAILTFNKAITNGIGFDFAVFENSFSNTFLELGFVEVSSDGNSFFRFPATSNTQDTIQVNSFGSIDATQINNLAGKYKALYGTPFDLEELQGIAGLDLNNITHVKIIDVVGTIEDLYATKDINNNKVNDPYPTAFASSGFDLDAVGVINERPSGINENRTLISLICPMPANESINLFLTDGNFATVEIANELGQILCSKYNRSNQINISTSDLSNGLYILKVTQNQNVQIKKIVVQH